MLLQDSLVGQASCCSSSCSACLAMRGVARGGGIFGPCQQFSSPCKNDCRTGFFYIGFDKGVREIVRDLSFRIF